MVSLSLGKVFQVQWNDRMLLFCFFFSFLFFFFFFGQLPWERFDMDSCPAVYYWTICIKETAGLSNGRSSHW